MVAGFRIGLLRLAAAAGSATARRRARLATLIADAFRALRRDLRLPPHPRPAARWGVPCGPELVRGIMRELGLQPCQPRPWRASLTEQDGHGPPHPRPVARDFTAERPGQKLVGDITYIPTWEGWLYLATVIDCHTKMVIGYAMGDNYKTPLIAAALHRAAAQHTLDPGCDISLRSRQQLHLPRVRGRRHGARDASIGRADRNLLR